MWEFSRGLVNPHSSLLSVVLNEQLDDVKTLS
jgi:hypothetical protein